MKTKAHIEIDFQLAMREAERLETVASNLVNAWGNLLQIMDSFSGNWSGANARMYRQKYERVCDEIYATSKEIRNIASDIRAIAKRIYDAEMRAYEIACRRMNGNYSSSGGFGGGGGGGRFRPIREM